MKNKILLICGFLVLILFIVLDTFYWYRYFLGITDGYEIVINNNRIVDGDVILKDNGISVLDSEAISTIDEDAGNIKPYEFQIVNRKNKNQNYTLFIEDLPINYVDDGCTLETLLSRKQLKYQLKLNDKIVKEDYLSSIENNVLYSKDIDGNATDNYELRIFIHEDAVDWESKHYHYRVVLSKNN